MKQIHIKLSPDMHASLRIESAKADLSIQDFVLKSLSKTLPNSTPTKENGKFTFIDLFAGIGGIRLPFQELGGECVFTSEIDKFAKTTYQSFYKEIPEGDICEVTPCDIDDFDILLAGFPCQPFSQAGHKKGFNDTRGTLFFQIEKIIRCKMPRAFLLENVKGLKGHDQGRTFQVIVDTLESIGYTIKHSILAARDFNLPQNRERIYIVGFLDETISSRFEFPKPIERTVKLGDILEKRVPTKYTISDALWAGHQRRKSQHTMRGNGFGYSLFTANSEYVNTISARYYKDGSEILIDQKNQNPRKLTPLEAGRLQGFPDALVMQAQAAGVSDVQLYKQFGNAVAVNVIRHIAQNMLKAMQPSAIRV
jgi:DNA (cytosine-5)-methyltransferase 1